MSFRVTFKPIAKTELVEAIAWYEHQQPGLGRQFFLEAVGTLGRAHAHPELFPNVLAVFHGARDPRGLRGRL